MNLKSLFKNLGSEEKTLFSNYASLVVLQGLNYLLPLISIPYLTYVLGIEKFGLVMYAQAFMIFGLVITDFGFNYTATRVMADLRVEGKDFSELFFKVFWAKILLVIVTFSLLLIIILSFDKFQKDWPVYILSFGTVIGHTLFPMWFFQGMEKMKWVTVINVIAKGIYVLLIFIFVTGPEDYLKVPIFISSGFLIAGIISLIVSLKHVKWAWPKGRIDKVFYGQSFQAFIANSATTLYTSSNVFILGIFAGDIMVGVFVCFERIILACKNAFTPIYQALFPYISRQTIDKRINITVLLIPIIAGIGLLISLTLTIFGDEVLSLIYDDPLVLEYAYLFKLMSWVALFSGLGMLYSVLYAPAFKLFKQIMYISIIVGFLSLFLCLIFIPKFDVVASAYIMFTVELILCIITMFMLYKHIKSMKVKTSIS